MDAEDLKTNKFPSLANIHAITQVLTAAVPGLVSGAGEWGHYSELISGADLCNGPGCTAHLQETLTSAVTMS